MAGPGVPRFAAGSGAIGLRMVPTLALPEPGSGWVLVLMTMPPASLAGSAAVGETVGNRPVERDPLDGGGVRASEWRSMADPGVEPIPELLPEPLPAPPPDPLPATLRFAGAAGAIAARGTTESPVRRGGVPAADRRSEGRCGTSGCCRPANAAVAVSQDASESATSCAVC